jgi:hypothetical protein
MDLRTEALKKLKTKYESVTILSNSPALWYINSYPCNIRTASRKSGDKFWFDVTPVLYEKHQVEFFLYTCGDPEIIYVFPRLNFEHFIHGAHFGGQKQVPNFTIFDGPQEFEPAGHSEHRHNIGLFRNAFDLIPR